jgi:hypothetical protein
LAVGDQVDGACDADGVVVLRPERDLEVDLWFCVVEFGEIGEDVVYPALSANVCLAFQVALGFVLRPLDVFGERVEVRLGFACDPCGRGDVAVKELFDAVVCSMPW